MPKPRVSKPEYGKRHPNGSLPQTVDPTGQAIRRGDGRKDFGRRNVRSANGSGKSIEEPQADPDACPVMYDRERMPRGKMCRGRTPMTMFEDGKRLCREQAIT